MDTMLIEFQANHQMEVLKYLLTKADQWTEISETMANNSSKRTKTLQIRRLINTMENTFANDAPEDRVILELLEQN